MMAPHDTREIVIEFEKVQMIRKRARTIYTYCRDCGVDKDFVGVQAAATLFGISVDELSSFVSANSVHLAAVGAGGNGICVASLLDVMQAKQQAIAPKLTISQNLAIS